MRQLAALAAVLAPCLLAGQVWAAEEAPNDQPGPPGPINYADGQIHPWHIEGNVWLLGGEGNENNVVVSVGDEGALLVDSGAAESAGKIIAAVHALAEEHSHNHTELRTIINTGPEEDHVGANAQVRMAGSMVVAGNFAGDVRSLGRPQGADLIGHENLLAYLVADHAGEGLWPQDTVGTDVYNTMFNGEAIQLYHPHKASTDGAEMVMFHHSDVLVTGEVVSMVSYPQIDASKGGTIDGELVALNHILDIAVPNLQAEGGTWIVPGHGRLCDQSDIVNYKNILTTIRNRIQYYKNQGKTLEQVQGLKPTADYDGRWGARQGLGSPERFVETVYRTLPAKGPSFSMQTLTVVPAPAVVSGGKTY